MARKMTLAPDSKAALRNNRIDLRPPLVVVFPEDATLGQYILGLCIILGQPLLDGPTDGVPPVALLWAAICLVDHVAIDV